MTTKPNDFKIGVFVLIGIGLALAAVFIFGASKWFEGKTVEETYVAGDVGGLKVGSPVTLRGVPVGEVTKVNFTWNIYHIAEPRYVYVEFAINNNVPITMTGHKIHQRIEKEVEAGLRARIKSQGLAAGTVIVSLEYLNPTQYPPLDVPWKPQHDYIPSAPGQFSEIMANIDSIVANVKKIDFQKIGALAQDDLAAGKRVLTDVDKINLRQIGTNANALVSDLRDVAEHLKTLVGTNAISRTNLQTIVNDADALVNRMQGTIGRIDQALGRLDQTVGGVDINLLNDTLENLRRASRELKETITNIKQYPAGAILGKPPEPAQSVERPR
jgi:ABC-type transporter Mla subunit MlaD